MYGLLRSQSPSLDGTISITDHHRPQTDWRLFLLTSVLCNILLGFHIWRITSHGSCAATSNPVAEDITGIVEQVPRKLVVFQNDSRFIPYDVDGPWKAKDDLVAKSWRTLMPSGTGFLMVKNHEDYALPRPLTKVKGDVQVTNLYGMAAFHQIHCLELVLRSYLAYQDGVDQPEALEPSHVLHCFDYLRVALMCYGDTALEGADPGDDGLVGTRGWGVTHVCKDWDALYDMAVERAAPMQDLGRGLGIIS